MDIKGLDYNTQREKLILSEYGREVQMMVDYCKTISNKLVRQQCAETIIEVMRIMTQQKNNQNIDEKLWNHLAIMGNFELDIDYPYEIIKKDDLQKRPEPLEYPMQQIRSRHYGHMVEEMFEKLQEMPDGEERDELIRLTANQMKRSQYVWNRGTADDDKIISDLARFTNGAVQIDPSDFVFDNIIEEQNTQKNNKKKKK